MKMFQTLTLTLTPNPNTLVFFEAFIKYNQKSSISWLMFLNIFFRNLRLLSFVGKQKKTDRRELEQTLMSK